MKMRRYYYTKLSKNVYKSSINIISVGNITFGGSGKTPYVLYLANTFRANGKKVAIVLRGYKGDFEDTGALISNENEVFDIAKKAGDEAMMYANNLKNTPICVGKDRVKSIKLLEHQFPELDHIIMDDALQYLKVYQDDKICILNAADPVGNGFCLPSGILREPISVLKDVNTVVINMNNSLFPHKLMTFIEKQKNIHIIYAGYIISHIIQHPFSEQKLYTSFTFKGKKVLLLSGIGHPQSFENTLLKEDISFQGHISMPDHFAYTQEFIDDLLEKYNCFDYILTTEKDYMKLKSLNLSHKILVVILTVVCRENDI
jgi:tetraacyldisaccharide 4'-kinase